MSPFDLDTLIGPTAAIFFVTLLLTFQFTKWPVISLLVALVKAGIYIFYFGVVFDGTFTFLDDWSYLNGGSELINHGVGITNLAENWELTLTVGRGDHVFYYLLNAYAMRLFGEGYYAPVAVNVLLAVAVALFGARLAAVEFNMSKKTARRFFLFLLFHPDIMAWSNIVNGKDILVLLLHVLLLMAISIYLRGQAYRALKLAAPIILVLLFLRFYVPLVFAISLVAGNFLVERRGQIKYLLLSIFLAALAFLWVGESGLQYAFDALLEDLVNPFYGFLRFILTPIPFNTEANYAFLNISALIHWMLIPFLVYGFIRVWRLKTGFSRFLFFYVLAFGSLYALYGELQGPRHRVQMDYAIALFQFLGIMGVLTRKRIVEGQFGRQSFKASTA